MSYAAAILFAAAMSLCAAGAAAAQDNMAWPNGAKAAIALTYDDSLDSQLDYALPTLDKYDIKGTFFLTIEREGFFPRVGEWRAAAESGHELANHTLFHPWTVSAVTASDVELLTVRWLSGERTL